MDGIYWYIAANNTWAGVITDRWPYNNIPQKLYGKMNPNFDNYYQITLREDIWKYRNGNKDLRKCIVVSMVHFNFSCISLFHPYLNPYSFEEKER